MMVYAQIRQEQHEKQKRNRESYRWLRTSDWSRREGETKKSGGSLLLVAAGAFDGDKADDAEDEYDDSDYHSECHHIHFFLSFFFFVILDQEE